MKWKELDNIDAELYYNEYCSSGSYVCPEECKELRNDLCTLFSSTLAEIGIGPERISKGNNSYQVDYLFGIRLFTLLNDKYGMSVRIASTAGVWKYLSLCVVPDIVEMRYGKNHPDRFWKKAKRIWLRVLWWYIYLSWQGNEELTGIALRDNSTDEILQLVDRCGRGGYRVELYRELMRQYSELDVSERRKKQVFRKVMVLNTARTQVIEPGLVDGGERQYISELISWFMK